jgi:hypothetical protein
MTKRLALTALLALMGTSSLTSVYAASKRPNVVIFLADDQG